MTTALATAVDAVPADVPLFVDLDGTLVLTDVLYESFLDRVKRDWFVPLRAMSWMLGGEAHLKTRIAQGHALSIAALPYNACVLERIRAARDAGRRVYLATASHMILARQVADHLGVFDGVIATEPGRNVSGDSKLARLREQAGSDRFEYLGNSAADIPIWDAALHAGVAAPDTAARRWLQRHPGKGHALGEHLSMRSARVARLRTLRPHQWPRNLLVALPLLVAHPVADPAGMRHIALAFIALCLCTSAAGVIDDLLDLDADRAHPRKRTRPFASGAVPLVFGLRIAPALLLAAFAVGVLVSAALAGVLALYVVTALAWSLSLQRSKAVDVLVAVALDASRIVAGAVAIQVAPSPWLLGSSIVLLLGLAAARHGGEPTRAAAGTVKRPS